MIISTLAFTQTSASAESYVSGDFKYSFLDNGTAKIARYTGTATTLEIPNEIDGNKVTYISWWSFNGCNTLKSVTIPDTVTRINNFAFSHCNSLKNIYYTGTEKQWNNIKFNINNSFIITANIYYNYNQNQKPVARKTLKTPKIKLTSNKKQIKIKYTKVKNAVGFQVIYTIKNDSKLKTFNTKKSAIKTIKKLKAGRYKIQVRAFSKGKKYYSNWTEINTVKVK